MAEVAELKILLTANGAQAIAQLEKAQKAIENASRAAQDAQKRMGPLFQTSSQAATAVSQAGQAAAQASGGFSLFKNGLNQAITSLVGFAGPAGLVAAGVAFLATSIYQWATSAKLAEKEQSALNEAIGKAGGKTRVEADNIQFLVSVLNDVKRPMQERLNAYLELKKEQPGIIQNISKENAVTADGGKIIAARAKQLIEYIKLKGQQSALEKLVAENTERALVAQKKLDQAKGDNSLLTKLKDIANGGPGQRLLEIFNEFGEATIFADDFAKSLVKVNNELLKFDPKVTGLQEFKPGKTKVVKPFVFEGLQSLPKDKNDIKELNDAFEQLLRTESALNNGVQTPNLRTPIDESQFEKLKEGAEQATEAIRKFNNESALTSQVLEPIAGAFANIFDQLISGGNNALKSITNALKELISQLVATVAKAAALAVLMQAFGLGTGGFGSIFTSLLGFKIPGHAKGGITTSPHLAMVGEAGPEAIIPLDKLGDLFNNRRDSGPIQVEVVGRVSGNDLLWIQNRATRSQNRFS